MQKSHHPIHHNDRRLGSSWSDWDGDVQAHEGELHESPAIYFGLLAIGMALASLVLVVDGQMLISLFFDPYPIAIPVIVFAIGLPLLGWWAAYCLCFAAVVWNVPSLALPWLSRWLPMQVPFLEVCGRPLGVSRDRISSSCIAVTNALARLQLGPASTERPLLLLPRCLTPEATIRAKEIAAAEFDCPVQVMAGNKRARQKVREFGPTSVIAVACERDLVSGLYDFGHKLPIQVIANRRKNGPCQAAELDMDELRRALMNVRNARSGSAEPVSLASRPASAARSEI